MLRPHTEGQACMHTYISGTETSEQTCLVIISACCIGRSSHPCATPWTSASSVHLSHLSPRIGQGLASTSEFLPFLCRMFSLQSIQYHMMNDQRLCVASEIVADTFASILDISSLIVLKCLRTFELWQMTSCDRFRQFSVIAALMGASVVCGAGRLLHPWAFYFWGSNLSRAIAVGCQLRIDCDCIWIPKSCRAVFATINSSFC